MNLVTRRNLPLSVIIVVLGLGPVSGCVVGPDYRQPVLDMPDAWQADLMDGFAQGESNITTWWQTLGDPILDELIEKAAAGNLDLEAAFARVKRSRALRGVATGKRFPDVDGAGTYEHNRTSKDFLLPEQSATDDFMSMGVDATWEIDVWGRITRSIESADADLSASVEDYRDVLVLLFADVASNYVEVRALQARIGYAEQNSQTQRGTLKLTRDRMEAEIAPELDVRQAELNLARTESTIPSLERLLLQTIYRLGVLLGQHPSSLHEQLMSAGPIPPPPTEIAAGLPADILRQRPDIRRAERQLAAQTARIGVATADLYPRFTLSGTFAFEGTSTLFNANKQAWSLGPAFRWNIFDGGRVRGAIAVQDARTELALARYEQAVLRGLEDVEGAVAAFVKEQERRALLQQSVTAAQRSVELVQDLYRTGLTDFQNVLDSERSLFVQQDEFARSEGDVTQNLIRLYKALGGGWDPDPPRLAEEVRSAEQDGEPIF